MVPSSSRRQHSFEYRTKREHAKEEKMVSYTTKVGDRDSDKLKLTREEALAMAEAGFRFAEFNLEYERFRLSIPYQIAKDLMRGTVTYMQ
jgi:hypothetical protein